MREIYQIGNEVIRMNVSKVRGKSFLFFLFFLICAVAPTTLLAKVYHVYIDSTPVSGANIYINNNLKGVTSPDNRISVWGGRWNLRLELQGFKILEKQIVIATENQRFSYALEPAPAILDLVIPFDDSSAQGADIFIDNQPKGTAPKAGIEVPPGSHLVQAKSQPENPNPGIFSQSYEFKAGEPKIIPLKLNPITKPAQEKKIVSYLNVIVPASNPASEGASVFINGKLVGQAPITKMEVEPGSRLVEIQKSGFDSIVRRCTFEPNKEFEIDLTTFHLAKLESKDETFGNVNPLEKKGSLNLTVVSNGQKLNGKVVLDQKNTYAINGPIGDLVPGNHTIGIMVDGYNNEFLNIIVEPGKEASILVEMKPVVVKTTGLIRVILAKPVPGAQYSINGVDILGSQIPLLFGQGVEAPLGHGYLSVKKIGWGEVRKEINLLPGKTEVVQIDSGKLTIESTQDASEVFIDTVSAGVIGMVGQTFDVAIGSHQIKVQKPGYLPYESKVDVKPEQAELVQVSLREAPLDPEIARTVASAFGASTLQQGTFAFTFGGGYPSFLNAKFDLGVFHWKFLGLDAGIEFRSSIYENDVGVNVRFQAFRSRFFAIGLNTFIGGGGGPNSRNNFTFELGAPISILAGRYLKLTIAPYLQAYSDRLCPSEDFFKNGGLSGDSFGSDQCANSGNFQNYRNMAGQVQPAFIVDGTPVLDRFVGYRGMVRGVVEVSPTSHWTITAIVEGAPNQKERQQYTSKFNSVFPTNDSPVYGRLLFTYKFN